VIGVQVWVYKGMYTTERTEEESSAAGGRARARGRK
jgi:ribosomal protein S3